MKRPRPKCPCGGVLRSKQERAAGQCWVCQLEAAQRAAAQQANGKPGGA